MGLITIFSAAARGSWKRNDVPIFRRKTPSEWAVKCYEICADRHKDFILIYRKTEVKNLPISLNNFSIFQKCGKNLVKK